MAKYGRLIMVAVVSLMLSLGSTSVSLAATTSSSQVMPVNTARVIGGQRIATGYTAGESIIYPSLGMYNIFDNPDINWTKEAKIAYVKNLQAKKDLMTFLNSPYANSPEAQLAKEPLFKLTPKSSNSETSIKPNAEPTQTHYFNSGAYFNIDGDAQGGNIWDESQLATTGYPYDYAAWQPITGIEDLYNTPYDMDLSCSWTFTGISLSVTAPEMNPAASTTSNSASWTSMPQYNCWSYYMQPTGAFTCSSPLPTQTATQYNYGGTVDVPGSVPGQHVACGTNHSEGFNITGIWGNTAP